MAAIRKIVKEDDPQLHQPSVTVNRFGAPLHRLLDDMRETMYHAKGVGLAAPQVGINKRVIVVDDYEGHCFEMVNPEIISASGVEKGVEFCLSVPERGGVVLRATQVEIAYQDRDGTPRSTTAEGYLARIFQHEIDHLSGRLFTDIMIEEVRPEDLEQEAVPEETEPEETAPEQGRPAGKKIVKGTKE